MVRSMMSLTTLPMSFWGYALDSTARILHMVPTKKVNKTPYEMWHGKVPNMSYLKDTQKKTMGYYFYYPLENKNLVARHKTIRILIAIAAYYDYEIWQIDVKTTFLNGRLNEDVYMVQPEGFMNPKHPKRNPRESHWTTVKNILKYLRNTKDMFLVYGGDSTTELSVTCYTDASWETDQDDLRSQKGYVFVMNRGVVDWKSYKQSTTAMSSMEAEYIAAAEAAMEAIWIRKFIYGLGVVPSIDKPMDKYCDNTGAITIADEPGVQRGAKHF
ncbi:retrotransposon protein, putative, ty1-copia subclass [Tanacetum coccineum]